MHSAKDSAFYSALRVRLCGRAQGSTPVSRGTSIRTSPIPMPTVLGSLLFRTVPAPDNLTA